MDYKKCMHGRKSIWFSGDETILSKKIIIKLITFRENGLLKIIIFKFDHKK